MIFEYIFIGAPPIPAPAQNTPCFALDLINSVVYVNGANNQWVTIGGGGGSGNTVTGEIPLGPINGSNATFTLAQTPIAGSLALYQNGTRLLKGTDYALLGSMITLVTPPKAGDELQADYRH